LQANRTGFRRSTVGTGEGAERDDGKASHSLAAASPECTRWSRRQESWAMWIKFFLSRNVYPTVMHDSRLFSHNQSLCYELVPGLFRPHFLANEWERPIRNGEHCRPRERLLKPVICLFFAGHEFKPDCWSSRHALGHDGYPSRGRGHHNHKRWCLSTRHAPPPTA